MDLTLHASLLKAYGKAGGRGAAVLEALRELNDYNYEWRAVASEYLSADDIEILLRVAGKDPAGADHWKKRRTLRLLRALLRIKGKKAKPCVNVGVMVEAVRHLLLPAPRHWVYTVDHGNLIPWYVEYVKYVPGSMSHREYEPPHGKLKLVAKSRGAGVAEYKYFHRPDLRDGLLAPQLLEVLGVVPDSEELYAEYRDQLKRYGQYVKAQGEQFVASGYGEFGPHDDSDERSRNRDRWGDELDFERDGGRRLVLVDDSIRFGKDGGGQDAACYADPAQWLEAGGKEAKEELAEGASPVPVPTQPYICVFSLAVHAYLVTHVDNLAPYVYDKKLGAKLVLPPDHTKLIDVLIGTAAGKHEDIVQGKAGGTVILCSGPPGTGKTLTAEVYAETAGRPLYTVHCSQLGTTAPELEEQLILVLRRAARWRAILLIDEADVYIQERADDINRNAVVGVFLRLLEYFSGIMFMTTNRATVVDDAILSRCTSHIRYALPGRDALFRLWNILGPQFGLSLLDRTIAELVEGFPGISGRSIKQLCRLASAVCAGDETRKPSPQLFRWLAEYQDLEGPGKGGSK